MEVDAGVFVRSIFLINLNSKDRAGLFVKLPQDISREENMLSLNHFRFSVCYVHVIIKRKQQ